MLLVSKTHPEIVRLRGLHGNVGRLFTPRHTSSMQTTVDAGVPWACDNDAFGAWDEMRFRKMLTKAEGLAGCLFIAVPDVLGDALATLRRFEEWRSRIGQPLALVAQDGVATEDVPWDSIASLFIGGTTQFKMSWEASRLALEANERGKWVHVGRVNSVRRAKYARSIGAHSIDGVGHLRPLLQHPPREVQPSGQPSRAGKPRLAMSQFRAPLAQQIEWPRGSGRAASYTPRERAYMRRVAAAAKRKGESATLRNQLTVLHELKVVFGVDLVADAVST